MSKRIPANLENLSGGPRWRGHFDGLNHSGMLHGWVVQKNAPYEDIPVELFVHGIRLACTVANRPRNDVDKILELAQPANTGFSFDLKHFDPKGALALLRRFGLKALDIDIAKDLKICVATTQHILPSPTTYAGVKLDLSAALPDLVRTASEYLRREIQAGLDIKSLLRIDHIILLQSNPFFSPDWYMEKNREVAASGLDPYEHCSRLAAPLQTDTGPWFSTADYFKAAPTAQNTPLAPPLHYSIYGHKTWWPGQGRFRSEDSSPANQNDYAVLIHISDLDTVQDFQKFLEHFDENVDVFISMPKGQHGHDLEAIASQFPEAREILTVSEHGGAIAAFLEVVRHIKERGYRFFCHVHTQTSAAHPGMVRNIMFDGLAATPERVEKIVSLFRESPRILMSGPSQLWLNGARFSGGTLSHMKALTMKLGFGPGAISNDWAFFSESCFWIDSELALQVANVVAADDFLDADAAKSGEMADAVQNLFGIITTLVGGQIALTDGIDRLAAPIVSHKPVKDSICIENGENIQTFFARHLQGLHIPQTVKGTAAISKTTSASDDVFAKVDAALHGAIDVLISCFNGRPEPLHNGLATLGSELEKNGLTWGALVGSSEVQAVFGNVACQNVVVDSLYLRWPTGIVYQGGPISHAHLSDDFARSLIASEMLFLGTPIAEGADLEFKLSNVRKLYAYWREILLRHKVQVVLIWGDTAPKSRMFIHLCKDLEIEYQIIERGHFPGTLSIDPKGQFGSGVRPQLITHTDAPIDQDDHIDRRFQEIQDWYKTQTDKAAYAAFQKNDAVEVDVIRLARSQKRPIILVIGGNDQGSGTVRPGNDPLRVNWFGTSDKAFATIQRLVTAKFPDALLVLRPHPSQNFETTETALIARNASLDELIDHADMCISISSTTRAICLLKEKPLLTLGLSELNGQGVGEMIVDETHLLSTMRRHIWNEFSTAYPKKENRRYIVDLFENHLIGVDQSIPTRYKMEDLARFITSRHQRMKTGFLDTYVGRESAISEAMFIDVRDRGRAIFRIKPYSLPHRQRPAISVVLPIYGDYEGTRICFDQLVRHQQENGYRVIIVWDRGPDLRLRDLCEEYAEQAGFTYLENRENVGFSGTVNAGIIHAGRDDIILLNSDTVPCGDWALRLQDAAYAHPKIASVVPFSNNATIYNVPYMDGMQLPAEEPVSWAEALDNKSKKVQPFAVEMPVSHGYCTYVRRSAYDRLGLYDEMKFGIGQSEDNEFSLRARMAGYFCVCPTNVFMAHAGSTSFGDEVTKWVQNGRSVLKSEFSHYFAEIRHFLKVGDPLDQFRRQIVDYDDEDKRDASGNNKSKKEKV